MKNMIIDSTTHNKIINNLSQQDTLITENKNADLKWNLFID